MDSIADALAYAVTHINCREAADEELANDDDSAVSHIMAYLSDATLAEKTSLSDAAKRALAEEQSLFTPRQEMVDHFATWMEEIFGRDWNGNEHPSLWASLLIMNEVRNVFLASEPDIATPFLR